MESASSPKIPYCRRLYAFDTETVEGEPFTIQFAGCSGATLTRVTRSTILGTFLTFLAEHGDSDHLNLLWAHNLEFDAGVVFIAHPQIWATTMPHLVGELDGGGDVRITFHHVDNPFHQLTVQGRQWLILDTMSFFRLSLEEACRRLQLPVQKLPRPPYLGQRPPTDDEWPAFHAYATNDALAAYELGSYIVERHREFAHPPTVSIAHMAGTIFRRDYLREDLSCPIRTEARMLSVAVARARGWPVRQPLRVRIDPPIPFCETERRCDVLLNASLLSYHGGKNGLYVPPGVYENVTEVDIVSAYPYAMRMLPPLTKGCFRETHAIVPDRCAVYRVKGRVRSRCHYGVFMTIDGAKVTEGCFDTWVTSYELEGVLDLNEVRSVSGYYWEPAAGATNPFVDYVAFFFEKKQHTPGDDPRREMYKLLLNSLYGKLIQRVEKEDPMLARTHSQGGALFNPFWASMITGHCRARLRTLEHQYAALHASTDSILTHATTIPTGTALGDLEIKARGTLILLRNKLYVILSEEGRVLKAALHGFHGDVNDLMALIRRGGGPYTVQHMIRPREAQRTKERPFRMVPKRYQVKGVPTEVWTAVAAYLNRS